MIVICGRTCSGKDTFGKMLETEFGFKRLVSCTTRPMREGEENHVDYHFVTDEEYDDILASKGFTETTSYKQEDGSIWRYGSLIIDMEAAIKKDDKVYTILNPAGIKQLIDQDLSFHIIYLNCKNASTLRKRYLDRGGDEVKWSTRWAQDLADFKDFGKDSSLIKDWRGYYSYTLRDFAEYGSYLKSNVTYTLTKWKYIERPEYSSKTKAELWCEIENLKKDLAASRTWCDSIIKKYDKLDNAYRTETSQLKRDLADWQGQANKLTADYDTLYKDNTKLIETNRTLTAKLNYTKDALHASMDGMKKLKEKQCAMDKIQECAIRVKDLRKLIGFESVDEFRFYDANDFIFSISETGFSEFLTHETKKALDGFEVINIGFDMTKNGTKVLIVTVDITKNDR